MKFGIVWLSKSTSAKPEPFIIMYPRLVVVKYCFFNLFFVCVASVGLGCPCKYFDLNYS